MTARPPIGAEVSWEETTHGVTTKRRARVHGYDRDGNGDVVAVLEPTPGGPLMVLPPAQLAVEKLP